MLPVLNIGPLTLPTPAFVLLLGLWVALEVLERTSKTPEMSYRAATVGLVVGVLAARIAHAILYFDAYLARPLSLVSFSPANFYAPVGWLVGLAMLLVMLWRGQALNWQAADDFAPAGLVMAAGLALANLLGGSGYGLPTNLPWGIDIFGAIRHPTQVYDLLAALAILGVLWWRRKAWPFVGAAGLTAALSYATLRLLLDATRAQGPLIFEEIRVSQLLALVGLLLTLGLLAVRQQNSMGRNYSAEETPEL